MSFLEWARRDADLTIVYTIYLFCRKSAILNLTSVYTIHLFLRKKPVLNLTIVYTITLFVTFLKHEKEVLI